MTKAPRIYLVLLVLIFGGGLTALLFLFKPWMREPLYTGPRPNFLFVITDDQSWVHTSFAGYPAVQTPNFDRIAREGIYFENAFASAPTCTASRSAILTGRHFWELGPAAQLWGQFPADLQTYQQILETNGYKIGYSGKGWGPGYAPQGNPAGPGYNSVLRDVDPSLTPMDQVENLRIFLGEKAPDQPFSYWVSPTEPHRPYKRDIGKDSGQIPLSLVEVPPFLPDSEVIRDDIADYLFEIQWFDEELGRTLNLLKQQGLLDNTVVVYTSDNGMPFPRGKANNYDYGIRVPLAVRWGDQIKQHLEISDFISLIDIAPTFLELAHIPVPENMSGKSFVRQLLSNTSGWVDRQRDAVFSGFERHIAKARIEQRGYPSRAIRTDCCLYIKNLAPDRWPLGRPPVFDDIDDGSPSKSFLITQRRKFEKQAHLEKKTEGGMVLSIPPQQHNRYALAKDPAQNLALIAGKRPSEELYMIRRDPGQLNNVADDPAYAPIKEALAKRLSDEMTRSHDPWAEGKGAVFDSYYYYASGPPNATSSHPTGAE